MTTRSERRKARRQAAQTTPGEKKDRALVTFPKQVMPLEERAALLTAMTKDLGGEAEYWFTANEVGDSILWARGDPLMLRYSQSYVRGWLGHTKYRTNVHSEY